MQRDAQLVLEVNAAQAAKREAGEAAEREKEAAAERREKEAAAEREKEAVHAAKAAHAAKDPKKLTMSLLSCAEATRLFVLVRLN